VVDLLTLRIESTAGRAACSLLGSTVYALVSGGRIRDAKSMVDICQDIVTTARQTLRLDLVAAVGTAVDQAAGISASRAEADRGLLLLHRHPHLGPVTSTERASDQLSLLALAQLLEEQPELVSARARLIRAHDREHGTAYEEFLATWLDCHRDVAATAARTSAHPNTVRYRVRRAVQLFGLDLGDPDQMLVLWLSLRAVP
jgi:DNA-binding PucR family transcriptional regulator